MVNKRLPPEKDNHPQTRELLEKQ